MLTIKRTCLEDRLNHLHTKNIRDLNISILCSKRFGFLVIYFVNDLREKPM